MIRHHFYYSVDSSEIVRRPIERPRRSRFVYRPMYGYLVLALFVLVMSWEQLRTDAAAIEGAIPEQSIRLRILANSDSPVDQAVKRHVRDAVVNAMNSWVTGPASIEDARATIRSHMGELEAVIAQELQSRGFDYGFQAELAVVPFPTKMYGSRVYPAGDYEALRITLGQGAGQNWWCVLFPPLCFVDAATGEAAPAKTANTSKVKSDSSEELVKLTKADGEGKQLEQQQDGEAPKAKFFLVEIIESIIRFFKNLFS
ncbi:stage II sporulation protein R [Paenibacillus xylaniclasticus]|uniref:stage II sporulation protein R n=1 Tax=Paenibacillus xylaniclasticus TaxID=588083 RepID=UPI000FDB5F57|nr:MULTISPECIES: stage II sporulation protein R [Paenibacillus]GFN32731.1 stage II sporulation protein R [Paenibacillus curdlanolyticus]